MTTTVPRTLPPVGPAAAARLDGVHVSFGTHAALRGVDLAIPSGRLTVVVGPNGAGKSTLVEVLAGVRPVTSGRVTRDGAPTAFVPQRTAVPEQLPVTVREVVTMGAWGEAGLWRRVPSPARLRVADALEQLGLVGLARRPFAALSGGERQRTLLAQGLARGAGLLVLDEPTTGLDRVSATRIRDAVDRTVADGATVVCVSHDPAVVERAHRVVRLEDGVVVEGSGAS